MPYDETLAVRVRRALARAGATERKMMGGLVFLVEGRIVCGVDRDDLIVRVGRAGEEAALARPHTRPMEIGGRTTRGFVLVARRGTAHGASLRAWIARGVSGARASGKPGQTGRRRLGRRA